MVLPRWCWPCQSDRLAQPQKSYRLIPVKTVKRRRLPSGLPRKNGCGNRYAKERKQFGKLLAEFQAIGFQLARLATEVEAARLMVYNAARLKDTGRSFLKEAAMAKYFASQVAERVASEALEIFGGYGFTKDYPAEKFPNVLIEALGAGLPVVSTRWRGIPELIGESCEGSVLIETGDQSALEAAILRILTSNDAEYADFRRASRKRYEEKYTLEEFNQRMLDTFVYVFQSETREQHPQ